MAEGHGTQIYPAVFEETQDTSHWTVTVLLTTAEG